MRISHRFKFIFFSSPKTGSESVRTLLDPLSDIRGVPFAQTTAENPFHGHVRPIEVKAIFDERGWRYDDYYRFVFVRNPWARQVSLYQHLRNRGRPPPFGDWLKASRPEGRGGGGPRDEFWAKYGAYSLDAFAGDETGVLLVDDVFRLEDISSVPARLRERGIPIGPSAPIPWKKRQARSTNLASYYTPELIELVRRRYAKEIAQFGYEYPGARPGSPE